MSYCTKVKYLSNTTLMQAYFDCHVNDKNYINDNFNICQEASIERKRLDDTPDKVLSQSRGTVSVVNCSFRMKLCWCYNSKQCIMYRIVAIMCTWLAVSTACMGKWLVPLVTNVLLPFIWNLIHFCYAFLASGSCISVQAPKNEQFWYVATIAMQQVCNAWYLWCIINCPPYI